MKKMRSTKRALVLSALSLLVCVSMLVGSTFAWFTDSVSSSNNIIKSGNLDVELKYYDGDSWEVVTATTNVFEKNTLWEPGHTEVVYLEVSNLGSLALKYNLGVNIVSEIESINVAGEAFRLSDYIEFVAIDDVTTPYADRDAARAAAANGTPAILSTGYTKAGSIEAGAAEEYVALVVYMPETVGNEANYRTGEVAPEITLGINLMATQYTHEEDSFDNQYDVNATWLGTIPASLDETTLEIVPGGGTQTGTITVNSAEDLVYLAKLAAEWVATYSNGQGTNVGSYRENAGGKGTDYYYHWTWDIELAADLDMSNIPMDSIDISYWGNFDGNGHTIYNVVLNDGQDGLFINGAKAVNNLTVKNITVNAPGENTVGAVSGNGAMTNVHVVNATVNGGKYVGGICGKGSSFVNCSIKDSTVTGSDKTVGGLAGYSIGDPNPATVTGNTVENVTVTGTYNVGGLLGQAQNETVEGNTIKNVTVKSTLELPADASSNEVRAAEVAARSAFADTTIGTNTVDNVTIIEVANVGTTDELNDAVKAGEKNIALGAGTYTLPTLANTDGLTITGADDGSTVIGGDSVSTGFGGNFGKNTTIKNVTFTGKTNGVRYSYAKGGNTVFENCTFAGDSTYGFHIDQSNGATFTFNNCTFSGFNAFAGDLVSVTFNDCTFLHNGNYGHTNIWSVGYFNNCTFGEGATFGPRGDAVIYVDGVKQ